MIFELYNYNQQNINVVIVSLFYIPLGILLGILLGLLLGTFDGISDGITDGITEGDSIKVTNKTYI